MDLGAYAWIEDLSVLMKENGIVVPRLRGLRLMANEKPISPEEMEECAKRLGLDNCYSACQADFRYNPWAFEMSQRTRNTIKRYLVMDKEDFDPVEVRWDRIHGKKRKLFKYEIKQARKRIFQNYTVFNKYCGRNDVLYIHARIGGRNWRYYNGSEIAQQPWFLEKVDDPRDETYCDIYAKIGKAG